MAVDNQHLAIVYIYMFYSVCCEGGPGFHTYQTIFLIKFIPVLQSFVSWFINDL